MVDRKDRTPLVKGRDGVYFSVGVDGGETEEVLELEKNYPMKSFTVRRVLTSCSVD